MEKTKAGLESLTTRELVRMADREGIDIFPGLERVFIIQELLESGEREAPERSPEPEGRQGRPCPAPLPGRYNFTYLDVLVRDPLWAFAFWEIGGYEKSRYEAAPGFDGYCLRALPLENDPPVAAFIVDVGRDDTAWYVGFPAPGGRFRMELCLKSTGAAGTEAAGQEALRVIASSGAFSMPRLSPETAGPLARLSGAAHFSAIRPARSRTSV